MIAGLIKMTWWTGRKDDLHNDWSNSRPRVFSYLKSFRYFLSPVDLRRSGLQIKLQTVCRVQTIEKTDLLMWIDESDPNWAVHAAKIYLYLVTIIDILSITFT